MPLDHTSIIKTVTQRFGLKSLTRRDAAATGLGGVLTLRKPRQGPDIAEPIPFVPPPGAENQPPNSALQRAVAILSARVHEAPPEVTVTQEGLFFLGLVLRSIETGGVIL